METDAPNKDLKFLVVEDFEYMRNFIKDMLIRIGYNDVVTASEGQEAISLLEQDQNINFVISDWDMPKVDGLELLQWLRKNQATKTVPFIMVSGEVKKENLIEAVKSGVNKYIAKPFNETVLKKAIASTLDEEPSK